MSMADVFGNDSAVDPRMDDVLHPADVTILGVGNVILRDEGFGVRAAEYLDAHYDFPESVQVVDGGTLGIELTQYVTGTKKLLVIDSINGAISVINKIPGVSIGKLGRLGFPRLATGTDNWGGGWATVGEQGRENVWLPPGSKVFSEKDSKAMGGEVTNNFYGEMHFDSADAVDRFYERINRDTELAQMGMPT